MNPGKMANIVKGMAKANENPNMPMMGFRNTPWDEAINMDPAKGPVQENETKTLEELIQIYKLSE